MLLAIHKHYPSGIITRFGRSTNLKKVERPIAQRVGVAKEITTTHFYGCKLYYYTPPRSGKITPGIKNAQIMFWF